VKRKGGKESEEGERETEEEEVEVFGEATSVR